MRKKLFLVFGLVLMMLLTTITIAAESNDSKILSRTHIRAFGRFEISEEDDVLYGHIFFGFLGAQPVLNLDIEICQDSIRWIVMSGFSNNDVVTYRFLNCVVTE